MRDSSDTPARLFREAVDSSPNGVVIVDARGRIVYANREAERIFGYTAGELTGLTIEALVPSASRGAHLKQRDGFQRARETRAMGMGREFPGVRKDGTEVALEIGLSHFGSDDGDFVVAAVVDVGERLRAREELRRSNDDLERFAYVASHDLQEPLRTVTSFLHLLQDRAGGGLDRTAGEFVSLALQGARRMKRLIDDLLAVSRVDSHGAPMAEVDLGVAVRRAVGGLAAAAEEAGAKVEVGPMPRVLGDAGQLEQLFANLVGNAIKFRGADPPRVVVTSMRATSEWVVSVEDNGIGIHPDFFDRIFVIFQRLHTPQEYDGTGMGLALCRRIVDRHGGRIWVESSPGAGATFRFTLPASEAGP